MKDKVINYNKSDLAYSISKKLNISESSALKYIDHIINDIVLNIGMDEKIEIRGFGVFSKKYIRPRKFINPKTKASSYISETASMHFKPSKGLLNIND
jgi:nucleoid DNA-binding protein